MKEMKFSGKKLLVLGSNVGSTDIVRYAQEHGAYVIAADYLPPEKSPAKLIADEAQLISTGDLDALGALIEERKINAVLAGISEFNLLSAMALSKKYNLPFYCNEEQWHSVEHKDNFRQLCRQHAVPCPKTYFIGEELTEEAVAQMEFPAVLKPVDASISAGVHICKTPEELWEMVPDALSHSDSKRIIVEEFAAGDEFTAHYTIANGNVTLSCIDNRYPISVHQNAVTIPVARIYPCLYAEQFLEQVDKPMKALCKDLGMPNGILFIQGIHDSIKEKFYVFEAGLRCAGEAPYRFLSKVNGTNMIHVLVDHAFGVESDLQGELEDPFLHGQCCGVVSFVARHGVVGSITGLEEAVAATPSVVEYECRYPVGTTTPDTDTLRQLMIRFVMICKDRNQMAKDVAYLNENITVLDTDGQDMVLKFLPQRLYDTK